LRSKNTEKKRRTKKVGDWVPRTEGGGTLGEHERRTGRRDLRQKGHLNIEELS